MSKKPYRLVAGRLPDAGKPKAGVYDQAIDDFVSSGVEASLVEFTERSTNTVYQGLYHALKVRPREGIALRRRQGGVWLVKE